MDTKYKALQPDDKADKKTTRFFTAKYHFSKTVTEQYNIPQRQNNYKTNQQLLALFDEDKSLSSC